MEDIIENDLEKKENYNVGRSEEYHSSARSEKKEKLKKYAKATVLATAAILIWFGIGQYRAAEKYEAFVNVVEAGKTAQAGSETDRIDYGSLPQGESSVRFMTIENKGKRDAYVKIVPAGSLRKMLKAEPGAFALKPGESRKVELILETKDNSKVREYEGKILIFKIPKI